MLFSTSTFYVTIKKVELRAYTPMGQLHPHEKTLIPRDELKYPASESQSEVIAEQMVFLDFSLPTTRLRRTVAVTRP
jgi:hypothetical protein